MQIDGAAAMIRHFEYLFLGKRLMQGDLTHRTGAGEPNRPPARDIEQPLVPLEATIQQVRCCACSSSKWWVYKADTHQHRRT